MRPQSTKIPRVCEHCDQPFLAEARDVRRGHGRFCSARCRDDFFAIPIGDRFWPRVNKTSGRFWHGTECWLWTGRHNGSGYGKVYFQGRPRYVHRVAFVLTYGDIPPGLFICHHCDTPACVRPEHLFVATHRDNMADMWEKGRARPQGKPRQRRQR